MPCITVCGIAVAGANADRDRFRRDVERARTIFAQCGVTVEQGSFTVLSRDPTLLDHPDWDCTSGRTDGITRLLSIREGVCGRRDIPAYYVRTIGGGYTGCGGPELTPDGLPAFVVADAAIPTTFAHELGHTFLGVGHSTDTNNLMYPNQGLITAEPPQLTADQCRTINNSLYTTNCIVRGPIRTPVRVPIRFPFPPPQRVPIRVPFPIRVPIRVPLSQVGERPTIAEVTQLLLNADESLDQVVALGPAAVPVLAQILVSSPNAVVRARAAGALARLGGNAAIEALRRGLQDPDPVVRVIAADGLRRLGGSVAEMALIGALKDHDAGVRATTLRSLEAFSSRAARNAAAEARRRQ